LNVVSQIDGLEDIALLVDVLSTEGARVHIVGLPKIIGKIPAG
jgi:hypothetical protein